MPFRGFAPLSVLTTIERAFVRAGGPLAARRPSCRAGKGNDQVRFEGYVTTLNPKLKTIAPVALRAPRPGARAGGCGRAMDTLMDEQRRRGCARLRERPV